MTAAEDDDLENAWHQAPYGLRRGEVAGLTWSNIDGPRQARAVPENGQALSQAEREAVLTLINTEAYADLSIGQIWARELDEGRYWCSASTMYRIARAAGQSRERRRLATYPAKVKPELLADGPSQVWTWDITKLRGPAKGIWFQLHVLIDIYSRFNPSWIISPVEESALAADFIAEAIERNGGVPHTVHADRGTSMTSTPVSALLADLGVTRSHSRARVSNDCEYESVAASPGLARVTTGPSGALGLICRLVAGGDTKTTGLAGSDLIGAWPCWASSQSCPPARPAVTAPACQRGEGHHDHAQHHP